MGEAKRKKQRLKDFYNKDPLESLIEVFAQQVIRELGEDNFASLVGDALKYQALKEAIAPATLEFMSLFEPKKQDALAKMFVQIHVALDEQEKTADTAIALLLASDVVMRYIQNQEIREQGEAAVEITFRQMILLEDASDLKAEVAAFIARSSIEKEIQIQ